MSENGANTTPRGTRKEWMHRTETPKQSEQFDDEDGDDDAAAEVINANVTTMMKDIDVHHTVGMNVLDVMSQQRVQQQQQQEETHGGGVDADARDRLVLTPRSRAAAASVGGGGVPRLEIPKPYQQIQTKFTKKSGCSCSCGWPFQDTLAGVGFLVACALPLYLCGCNEYPFFQHPRTDVDFSRMLSLASTFLRDFFTSHEYSVILGFMSALFVCLMVLARVLKGFPYALVLLTVVLSPLSIVAATVATMEYLMFPRPLELALVAAVLFVTLVVTYFNFRSVSLASVSLRIGCKVMMHHTDVIGVLVLLVGVWAYYAKFVFDTLMLMDGGAAYHEVLFGSRSLYDPAALFSLVTNRMGNFLLFQMFVFTGTLYAVQTMVISRLTAWHFDNDKVLSKAGAFFALAHVVAFQLGTAALLGVVYGVTYLIDFLLRQVEQKSVRPFSSLASAVRRPIVWILHGANYLTRVVAGTSGLNFFNSCRMSADVVFEHGVELAHSAGILWRITTVSQAGLTALCFFGSTLIRSNGLLSHKNCTFLFICGSILIHAILQCIYDSSMAAILCILQERTTPRKKHAFRVELDRSLGLSMGGAAAAAQKIQFELKSSEKESR